MILIYVAIGGALGASIRYLTVDMAVRFLALSAPLSVAFINMIGSLLMGLLVGYGKIHSASVISPQMQGLFITGLLGGFTTFSAFSLDAFMLWEQERLMALAIYIISSVLGSIILLALGMMIGGKIAG